MYDWRKMAPKEKLRTLSTRKRHGLPWHCPPHFDLGAGNYLISAACHEHAPIIGKNPQRMAECEAEILDTCRPRSVEIHAWCILPDHYHVLLATRMVEQLLTDLGRFHGRSSHRWNGQDDRRGRHVWHNCAERAMRSERHFWAGMNYVHNNPAKHEYVDKWQDWPFSSAADFLEQVGRTKAEEIWREYPVLDYGKDWDVRQDNLPRHRLQTETTTRTR